MSGAVGFMSDFSERMSRALSEAREALHRRGRLSSRHQALDEVSRLLFAHMAGVQRGRGGLGTHIVAGYDSPARALKERVHEALSGIPLKNPDGVDLADFELALRDDEDALAVELLRAFDMLGSVRGDEEHLNHVLNDVFGRFISDSFIDEKELGQYLTPPDVVDFMVELALDDMAPDEISALSDPKLFSNFGIVMDPSCGAGSCLTTFLRRAESRLDTSAGLDWLEEAATSLVAGIDKSSRMYRLSALNLSLLGGLPDLHLANALSRGDGRDARISSSYAGKAGLILTNPPFGATFSGDDIRGYQLAGEWANRSPKSIDSELLFMERYLEWLRPGGQLVTVVPDSILTNRGIFQDLRDALSSQVEVRSVISLPSVTFAATGTSTKTSILHLRRSRDKSMSARFAVCSDIGYSVKSRGSIRTKIRTGEGELSNILAELRDGGDTHVVEIPEFHEAGRWDAGYHAAEIGTRAGGVTPVSEVADLVTDRVNPTKLSAGPTFSYIEISDVNGATLEVSAKEVAREAAPSRARQVVRAGDVLVSTVRPERGSIGVVPQRLDGAICTTGFAVLRPTAIDSHVLAMLLKTSFVVAQMMRNNVGIAYPAIEHAVVPSISLPATAEKIAHWSLLGQQLSTSQARAHSALVALSEAVNSVE